MRLRSSFVGESQAIHELRRTAARVADAPFPVLIEGETGTGKFELALLIHESSSRASEAFVDIHCANLSDTLFESTLFGHERGAFTDARDRRVGRVEVAAGGTILFDEVDCLSPVQQPRLLRFVDRRCYERVGGRETLTTNAAFLFTTNRSLSTLVSEGSFRSDLFFRIGWLVLRIPPLRDRPEDIALLAALLLEQSRTRLGLPRLRLTASALDLLRRQPWLGNVRELSAFIQVVAYLHSGEEAIDDEEVQDLLARGDATIGLDPTDRGLVKLRTDAERQLIAGALRATAGNRARAAQLLKIGRRTLQAKIAKYGL
jgi:DNA-binding NtrC family response regulator